MNTMNILAAVLSLGLLGLVLGCLLAVAAKAFEVKTDARIDEVAEKLPGANCAGCGFAGCSSYAKAMVEGTAKLGLCNALSDENAAEIAAILGTEAVAGEKLCAEVRCCGTTEAASTKYEYRGIEDCNVAMRLAEGEKACRFSCMGHGSCEKACRFGAIRVVNGVAVVDRDKCTGCGACADACPKHLITLVPKRAEYFVGCNNKDKGATTRSICAAGCIGCKICEKNCPSGSITVTDNFAKIDYTTCTNCGTCYEKCPRKIIRKKGKETELFGQVKAEQPAAPKQEQPAGQKTETPAGK